MTTARRANPAAIVATQTPRQAHHKHRDHRRTAGRPDPHRSTGRRSMPRQIRVVRPHHRRIGTPRPGVAGTPRSPRTLPGLPSVAAVPRLARQHPAGAPTPCCGGGPTPQRVDRPDTTTTTTTAGKNRERSRTRLTTPRTPPATRLAATRPRRPHRHPTKPDRRLGNRPPPTHPRRPATHLGGVRHHRVRTLARRDVTTETTPKGIPQ